MACSSIPRASSPSTVTVSWRIFSTSRRTGTRRGNSDFHDGRGRPFDAPLILAFSPPAGRRDTLTLAFSRPWGEGTRCKRILVGRTDRFSARERAGAGRTFRPSEGPDLPLRDGNVGALLLLRDARPARPLHDEISAATGPCRARRRARYGPARARSSVRAAGAAAFVVANLRVLHGPRLFHADLRRPVGGSRARPAPHRRPRRRADGDRPFYDG